MKLLKELCVKEELTVIAVFHDFNLASSCCNKLMLLSRGRIEALGKPVEVLTEENIRKVFHAQVVVEHNRLTNSIYVVPYRTISFDETLKDEKTVKAVSEEVIKKS